MIASGWLGGRGRCAGSGRSYEPASPSQGTNIRKRFVSRAPVDCLRPSQGDSTPGARSQFRADYRMLDYVVKQGSPIGTRASFTIESGKPGLQKS